VIQWSRSGISVILGIVAIFSVVGVFSGLPHVLGFFVVALSTILFPGIVITRLLWERHVQGLSFLEKLSIWFAIGLGTSGVVCFIGLLLRLTLHAVMLKLAVLMGALVVLEIIRLARATTQAEASSQEPKTKATQLRRALPTLIILALAIGFSLITLTTPRDYDDWFYLAYISDYVDGKALASEDAIFNEGAPAPIRIWTGGAWWVLEAILSKSSGLHPVDTHQVYLPLMLVPFAALAAYTLAKALFQSTSIAVAGCLLQMIFYLSSAFPYKSAGWFVFCRISQDKALSCFVTVPVAAAIAITLIRQDRRRERLSALYLALLAVSTLVHGMGPLWTGLLVAPLALVEWTRRGWQHTKTFALILLPFVGYGIALILARQALSAFITSPPHEVIPIPSILSHVYWPGKPFGTPIETFHPIVSLAESVRILNPLFVTRFPLAIAGVLLTLIAARDFRRDIAARFLVATTALFFILAFTPPGLSVLAWLINPRLVFRMVLLLPWGLAVAFALSRLKPRPILLGVIIAAITLGLARGQPKNYIESPKATFGRNRASEEAREVLTYLAAKSSPQGRIFASERIGRMIPAFVPDAYPLNFREFGILSREDLARMTKLKSLTDEFLRLISDLNVRFVLLENELPLVSAISESDRFRQEFRNSRYSVWRVENPQAGERSQPTPQSGD